MRPLKPLRPAKPATSATSAISAYKPAAMLPSEVAATLRPVATSGLAGTRVAGGRSHPATCKLNDSATFAAQVAEVAEVATLSAPEMPCLACGGGAFVRSPGASWRCTDCEPVALPPANEQAMWAFRSVPGGRSKRIRPSPAGPRARTRFYPDTTDLGASIGMCRGCSFTAPLSIRQFSQSIPSPGWALCDAGPADMTMTQLRAKRAAPVPLPRTAPPPWPLQRRSSCAVGVRSVRCPHSTRRSAAASPGL